jgi:hypothetical protein
MEPERKRQLKAAGKAEVQRRSAELRAALDAANPLRPGEPGWAQNYKVGTRRGRWLRARQPTLWRSQWEPWFVLRPDTGNRWIAHPGAYVQCLGCGTVAPSALRWHWFYWARCECGNLRWRCLLGWRRLRLRDAGSLAAVRLIGRGDLAPVPGEPDEPSGD